DPGQTIALRVSPADLGEPGAPPPEHMVTTAPVYAPPVVVAPSVYYVRPYPYAHPYPYYRYPSAGVQLYFGGGYPRHGAPRHHGHGHGHGHNPGHMGRR
ncbi:MAG: hypothetical protein ABL896_08120, partial [Hylemonella sp.]